MMKKRWLIPLAFVFLAALYFLRKDRQQVLNRMRFFNKQVLNPFMLRIARFNGSPIAIVYHVGRRSQKPYQTPVIVMPVDGGFVFALTYGPDVDWYRNILAAGKGRLRWHGNEYTLENPQPVNAPIGMQAFPPPLRAILQVIGPDHYFRMDIAPTL